jgi:hypothetical protein
VIKTTHNKTVSAFQAEAGRSTITGKRGENLTMEPEIILPSSTL